MYQKSDEIWRLPRHFRTKCITQSQKTRLELKVVVLLTGQRPKARSQQHRIMVNNENISWAAVSPDLKPTENLWRGFKSAIAKKSPLNLKELECITVENQQKLPVEGFKKHLDGHKKHLRLLFWGLPKVCEELWRVPVGSVVSVGVQLDHGCQCSVDSCCLVKKCSL